MRILFKFSSSAAASHSPLTPIRLPFETTALETPFADAALFMHFSGGVKIKTTTVHVLQLGPNVLEVKGTGRTLASLAGPQCHDLIIPQYL